MNSFIKTHAQKITKIILLIVLTSISYTCLQAMKSTNPKDKTIAIYFLRDNSTLGKLFSNQNTETFCDCLPCWCKTKNIGNYYQFFDKKLMKIRKNKPKLNIEILNMSDSYKKNKIIIQAPEQNLPKLSIELYNVNYDDPEFLQVQEDSTPDQQTYINNFVARQITQKGNLNKVLFFITYDNSRGAKTFENLNTILNTHPFNLSTHAPINHIHINFSKETHLENAENISDDDTSEDSSQNSIDMSDDEEKTQTSRVATKQGQIKTHDLNLENVCAELNLDIPKSTNCFKPKLSDKEHAAFTVNATAEFLGELIQEIATNETKQYE